MFKVQILSLCYCMTYTPKKEAKYSISYLTTCQNRTWQLKQTLHLSIENSLSYTCDVQFVLLDYYSTDDLHKYVHEELKEHLDSGKLVYIDANSIYPRTDAVTFDRSKAKNMVAKYATGDILCWLDADNIALQGFTEYINDCFCFNSDIVLQGDFRVAHDVGGRIACMRSDYERTVGYDESLVGYNHEDVKFVAMLVESLELKRLFIHKRWLEGSFIINKKQIRIFCLIDMYPPDHNCGSEMYMHALNSFLTTQGHCVSVCVHNSSVSSYENVNICTRDNLDRELSKSHVILTHLHNVYQALELGKIYNVPVVQFINNTFTVNKPPGLEYCIYNTNAMKQCLQYACKSCVAYPFVNHIDYYCHKLFLQPKDGYITLINCCKEKGHDIFASIARQLPNVKFLGVIGGYNQQCKVDLPNVTYVEHTSRIKDIYQQTSILLVPSFYESYGRVIIEAFSSGTPVLVNTINVEKAISHYPEVSYNGFSLEGMYEGGADALIKCASVEDYIFNIEMLLSNNDFYNISSLKCLHRAKELDPSSSLRNVNNFINDILES